MPGFESHSAEEIGSFAIYDPSKDLYAKTSGYTCDTVAWVEIDDCSTWKHPNNAFNVIKRQNGYSRSKGLSTVFPSGTEVVTIHTVRARGVAQTKGAK